MNENPGFFPGLLSAIALLGAIDSAGAAAPDPRDENMEVIEVVGVTPTGGIGIDKNKLAGHIQLLRAEDIARSQALGLAEFLNRQGGSVSLNTAQGNPLQPDLHFRGFTASPLLGSPQGLAVYLNGGRVNEPFGDTVNWDLLPETIIAKLNLVAGASPLYGLNALGGALALESKTGFSHQGHSLSASAGSFRRREAVLESGDNNGRWGYYLILDHFEEDGWRDFSDSEASNLYTALNWRGEASALDTFFILGDSELRGNGASPINLLAADREAVFTHPDITENQMFMTNLSLRHWLTEEQLISANLFYRRNKTDAFNGDASEFDECNAPLDTFLCEEEELDEPIEDQFGNALAADFDAINNLSDREQTSWGGTLQFAQSGTWLGKAHQLTLGLDFYSGDTEFESQVEVAELTATRSTTRSGLFVAEDATDMETETRNLALYLSDTLALTPALHLTVSGRLNRTRVEINDTSEERAALNGEHDYQRFNPAVGLSYRFKSELHGYLGYSESNRAPTPVELACSHEDAPCHLPNTFLADPPLDDVVSKSFEMGLRGTVANKAHWHAGVFDTVNRDDIIFQTTGGASATEGFFTNVGDTRRRGLELEFRSTEEKASWFFNYSYVRATFEDAFIASSPNHPQAENGTITVSSGDRIPGIPAHNVKLGMTYHFSDALALGFDAHHAAGRYYRGDEANLLGKIDDYQVVNLHGDYRISRYVAIFAAVNNIFDSEYESFGLLGEADEVLEDYEEDQPRFLSPGEPRSISIGIRLNL